METKPVPSSEQPEVDAFFIRKAANEGIDLPLALPDGTPTKHTIRIRSSYSDAFRAANTAAQRKVLEIGVGSDLDPAERAVLLEREKIKLIASLVISWTFPIPCTFEEVVRVLTEAPQIADEINNLAARHQLFSKAGSSSSTPSPAQSST